MSRVTLSLAQARRTALAAQGLGLARPERTVGMRDVQSVVSRLGQFQIDSVNVVRRAHYLPLLSRVGPYDPALLDRAAHDPPRRVFEYWGHAASLIDVSLQPLLRFRMQAGYRDVWSNVQQIASEQPALVDWVLGEVARLGPVSARKLEQPEERDRSNWGWNWSSVKTVLEWLFYCGEVTSARRNSQFERVYDLPERVLPRSVLAQPTPAPADAVRGLVRRAAAALGVASELSLRDYFRTRPAMTRQAISELVESHELLPVSVRGLEGRPHYLWHRARMPRRIEGCALVSPFDSMVFERSRLEQLFGFVYRIEIYVPEPKRVHGYYVYPFLLGDRFVARVDLKADRLRGVLRVMAAWSEPVDVSPGDIAVRLVDELTAMAGWLGLSAVEVLPRGDLAAALLASGLR
ncbi:MAG TPA: crosslink repair DNA glycosylase YcaQ family protein [Propionibacteriaceae bacterium]|nr:crosslink repair DNA glycosylase YcaQ family protein [Propionibacteriaceae bacterium]